MTKKVGKWVGFNFDLRYVLGLGNSRTFRSRCRAEEGRHIVKKT